jgi:hypothetical protein
MPSLAAMTMPSIQRVFSVALLLGLMAGCERKSTSKSDAAHVEPGARPIESADGGFLPLKIVKSHTRQKPLEQAPWHGDGGDWTFLDCQLAKDATTAVVIGVRARTAATGDSPFAWGEAIVAVSEAQAGGRFVDAFAKAFQQTVPPSHGNKPPGRLNANTAVLGSNLKPDRQGGFREQNGTWTATKWFFGEESGEAEVFFNYSVAEKKAEFSEKDADYREALVEQLVICLRDGPLPERTPENDPNLTLSGPRATGWTRMADAKESCQFSPDSGTVVISESMTNGGTRLSTFSVEGMAGRKTLGQFDGAVSVEQFLTNRQELRLLITETLRPNPKIYSSTDPKRLWLVRQGERQAVFIPAGLTNWYTSGRCVSPDERFLALHEWKSQAKNKRIRIIHLSDLAAQKWQVIERPETVLELVGWKNGQAVVLTGAGFDKTEVRQAFELDPTVGKLNTLERVPDEFKPQDRISPDGRFALRVEEKRRLVLMESGSGKTREFLFHPYDRRHVFAESAEWASPKYLVFQGARTALIDVDSLKMSFPSPRESGFSPVEFSPDFKRALGRKADGIYLGHVESQ